MFCTLAKFPVNYANSTQFTPKIPQIRQNLLHSPTDSVNDAKSATFIYPLYIMFQMPALAENSLKFQQIKQNSLHSPTDSTNDAKFTSFIYPLYIMFQMPALAENSRKFQQIK